MADSPQQDGPPQWLDVLSQAAPAQQTLVERLWDRYGFPSIVAVGLGFALYQFTSGELRAIRSVIDQHVTDTRLDQSEIRFYLRAICLNTAQTESQRAACVLGEQTR